MFEKPEWIPFGSRRWGGWTSASDYDFLVYIDAVEDLLAEQDLEALKGYDGQNHLLNSFHFYTLEAGKRYNFIVYEDRENLHLAIRATKYIDEIALSPIGRSMSTNKHFRHTIVEKTFTDLVAHEQEHAVVFSLGDLYAGFTPEVVPFASAEVLKPRIPWEGTTRATVRSARTNEVVGFH